MRHRRLPALAAIALTVLAGEGFAQPATLEASLEQGIGAILRQHDVPGASVAIARNGRLVYARGFGLADREARLPVGADTRFRIASLSKPITAATILGLVSTRRLSLDASVQGLLTGQPRTAQAAHAVTVRHLLQHTAQWGPRGPAMEPVDLQPLIRRAGGTEYARTPFRRLAIAALDDAPRHKPGAVFGYSTFGYCVLGTIIQAITGLGYQEAARRDVLLPAGAPSFALATTYAQGRLPNEARTYDYAGAPRFRVTVDGVIREVPRPDAYWSADPDQRCAAAGRWVATPRDYLRVMTWLGRNRAMKLLFDSGTSVPTDRAGTRFAHGLFLDRPPDGPSWYHDGSYAGTATAYARTASGVDWVVFYNGRPQANQIYVDTFRLLRGAIRAQKSWPSGAPL